MIFKGTGGEGQSSLFANILKKYIEETSASIVSSIPQSQNQLADINSFMAAGNQSLGQGGENYSLDPSTVQDSSVMAHNPASTDYIETGFRRNQIVEYTIQPGDLLSFIASDYGVSINSIIWANDLKSANSISPGQTLRIPPVSGVIHKVKKGDTIASIAKKYGVTVDKVATFNELSKNETLELNDEIIVPDGEIKQTVTRLAGSSGSQRFSYLPDLGSYFFIPTIGHNWGRIHGRNSVDIANSCGTPIYAAADGVATIVDAAGWNGGFGEFIKLIHPNGTETVYAHASKLLITAGQSVARGQQIANMGTTGHSTGCHLHFEVHGAKNPLAKR